MTVYASKFGKNLPNTHKAIAERRDFDARSLKGKTVVDTRYESKGELSDELIEQFHAERPSYVVYSYATPIAWYGKNGWTQPSAKYSATTSNHQSVTSWGISHG